MPGPKPKQQDGPVIEWREIDVDELGLDWDDEPAESQSRPTESRPTLVVDDPLLYDRVDEKEPESTGESRPTVVDIDPLRHDVSADEESRPTLYEPDPLRYDRDE